MILTVLLFAFWVYQPPFAERFFIYTAAQTSSPTSSQTSPSLSSGSIIVQEPKVQWASKLVRITAQLRNIGAYSAYQLLGKPNILSRTGETNPCSWASSKTTIKIPVSITDNLRVGFAVPVVARQVAVAENLNPGAITAIIVRGTSPQEFDTVYKATARLLPVNWRMLNVFRATPFKVSEVELVVNVGLVPGTNEIDAIALGTTRDTIKPDINLISGAQNGNYAGEPRNGRKLIV